MILLIVLDVFTQISILSVNPATFEISLFFVSIAHNCFDKGIVQKQYMKIERNFYRSQSFTTSQKASGNSLVF